ncbi:hypothetical protein D0859_04440 [Hortaea werneckii]|uniref:Endoplasmic reticulum junction formation protein lunapark n=1 Tax=Hortaea werneckii TaxID=91943 RepID=A0A3M7J104_HORWE|nr:hypothetical protein D0859_04440 [Hortaea werneckii]
MVSFWPFKGDNNSAASFEKILSQLSTKINKASAQNDGFRQRQRRFKALWTLYTSFAYILVAAILTLVTGYERWSSFEYSALAGGPVVIYGARTALDAYYNYRLAKSQDHLNDLYQQREKTITKLKEATKYDSTQQLLDKYGGAPKKQASSPQPPKKSKPDRPSQSRQSMPAPGQMTGFAPPPTANIQRPQPAGGPMPPPGPPPQPRQSPTSQLAGSMQPQHEPNEEFAPNAYPMQPSRPPPIRQQSTQYAEGPKWYDRILDVVLGEDETQAKNRIVLICDSCKLVNGQAPPGARTLEDVGRWRCSACHAWNGVESEEKKIMSQIKGEPRSPTSPASDASGAVPKPVAESEDESGDYEHIASDLSAGEDPTGLGTGSERTTRSTPTQTPSTMIGSPPPIMLNRPPFVLWMPKAGPPGRKFFPA